MRGRLTDHRLQLDVFMLGKTFAALLSISVSLIACRTSSSPESDAGPLGAVDSASPDAAGQPEDHSGGGGPCYPLDLPAGLHSDLSIIHEGRERKFDLFVPEAARGLEPLPLVMDFHGFGANEDEEAMLSGLRDKASEEGFLLLSPRGLEQEPGPSWNGGDCCPAAIEDGATDDVALVRALLEWTEQKVCVDRRRVYATGISNGGFMTNRLACEASDVFAAIAPIAGVGPASYPGCGQATDESTCEALGSDCDHRSAADCVASDDVACSWTGSAGGGRCVNGCSWQGGHCVRRFVVGESGWARTLPADGTAYSCEATDGGVAVLHVHGDADPLVPWDGQSTPWGRFLSVPDSVDLWRQRNGCAVEPTSVERYECPYDPSCSRHRSQRACTVAGSCQWAAGACHSQCDVLGQCKAAEGAPILERLTCHRNRNAETCVAQPQCEWQDDECEDCRDLTCTTWGDCTGSPVTLCINESGGHCWPGSGECSVAQSEGELVRATDLIWSFFSGHPKRP